MWIIYLNAQSESNEVWGPKPGGDCKWTRKFKVPIRAGVVLDIVGQSIHLGACVCISLCEPFCWMSHHPLSKWGPVHPVCFHAINVLGTLHRLAGLSVWAVNRLCGWWDKEEKTQQSKKGGGKPSLSLSEWSSGHKGDFVNHASFVIRMGEAFI